ARALAEQPELEVAFSSEPPGVRDGIAHLPHPPRDLASAQAQALRGVADQIALRLAHHDPGLHARQRPADAEAAQAFEAAETARIEAVGARTLEGVRANLTAALEARLARRPPTETRLPLDEVLG